MALLLCCRVEHAPRPVCLAVVLKLKSVSAHQDLCRPHETAESLPVSVQQARVHGVRCVAGHYQKHGNGTPVAAGRLDIVSKILENEPNNIVAKNVKGNVLGRGYGRLDDAIKIFEEIVAEQPDFSSAWENMGIAYAIKQHLQSKAQEDKEE